MPNDIYLDETSWSYFGDEEETIAVYRKCPICCKYVSKGKVSENGLHELKFENWNCKTHGAIIPYFERD